MWNNRPSHHCYNRYDLSHHLQHRRSGECLFLPNLDSCPHSNTTCVRNTQILQWGGKNQNVLDAFVQFRPLHDTQHT